MYFVAARIAGWMGRLQHRPGPRDDAHDIVVTLNFHASGWPVAVLRPLAMSSRCARLRVVTTAVVPDIAGVEPVYPGARLRRVFGDTGARLLTFAWICWRTRPHVVGGVHLLLNGLLASLVARATGARSLYICVGGPNEVAGGGLWSENRLFGRLTRPDATIERRLIEACSSFDVIVTQGSRAVDYFAGHGVRARCHVIPSSVDDAHFRTTEAARDIDVIMLARLVPLKRLDLSLQALERIVDVLPSTQAVVIGDGPLRHSLEALAGRLGLEGHVRFLGYQPDVAAWLRRAKVFLLTSDSEGVSIALLEAMSCGVVPVTSHVGDLADVIEHGRNGFLVEERSGPAFARFVVDVLSQAELQKRLADAAVMTARRHQPTAIAARWTEALRFSKDEQPEAVTGSPGKTSPT